METPEPNQTDAPPHNCLRCDGEMEPGFMLDNAHGSILQARWCPGFPEAGWVSEIKSSLASKGVKTVTFRCTECGHLESFAYPAP